MRVSSSGSKPDISLIIIYKFISYLTENTMFPLQKKQQILLKDIIRFSYKSLCKQINILCVLRAKF
jgi:hypothetical protein